MSLYHRGLLCAGILSTVAACGPEPAPALYMPGRSFVRHDAARPRSVLLVRAETEPATSGTVHIDERIVQACGNLPAPHFAFDSANIHGDAAELLRLVGRCFTEGPLQGRSVRLVGRADPRGTAIYNLALGQDRSMSVARFLEQSGVSQAQITTMSRGELDATGRDEEGWALDRRVDIVLGD